MDETHNEVVAGYTQLDATAVRLPPAAALDAPFQFYLSHELRHPRVLIIEDILRGRPTGPSTGEQRPLNVTHGSLREPTDIVDDLSDRARVKAGQVFTPGCFKRRRSSP